MPPCARRTAFGADRLPQDKAEACVCRRFPVCVCGSGDSEQEDGGRGRERETHTETSELREETAAASLSASE